MKHKIKTLVKKELYEFKYNYKTWLLILISVVPMYIPTTLKRDSQIFLIPFLIMLSIGQYIYNTCADEHYNGGELFLHNCKISFKEKFLSKTIFAFLIAIIIFLVNTPNNREQITLIDFLWIFPMFTTIIALTIIGAIHSQNSEDTTSTISILASAAIIILLLLLKNIIVRMIISILSMVLAILIANSLSKSIYYRAQL